MLYPLKEVKDTIPLQIQQLELIIKGIEKIIGSILSEDEANEINHPEIYEDDIVKWGGYSGSRFAMTNLKWAKEAGFPVSLGIVDTKKNQLTTIDSSALSTIIWMQSLGGSEWYETASADNAKSLTVQRSSHNPITQELVKEKFRNPYWRYRYNFIF
ncbi:hypothetical protein BHYA_0076g00320 [Botrytis hyacinthi]|uniref:Uncharacterized protein n=1 Tax=Botrytis hyacinthi TaxID=278943 RepID=A0A4Z1GTY7_9HELO|nr:hypothetical protein BHYA_0076g00320 [Botrytis hyacinthi]